MSIFKALWKADSGATSPTSDFWYKAVSESGGGELVTADSAMKVSTVYACTSIISEDMGKFPIRLWEWVSDHVKQKAVNHPLYELLLLRPNPLQTWSQFAELMTWDALLRSAGFAEIVPGPRGFADQLWRIHPDTITIEKISQRKVRYRVKEATPEGGSRDRLLSQDQVFVLPGKFFDGFSMSNSPIRMMAKVMSIATAKQSFEKTLFNNGTRLSGALQTDATLDDQAFDRLRKSWQDTYAGPSNTGKVAILEKGLKFQPISMTSEDAEFVESTKMTARDITLFFRVPPHKVGIMDNANYSNIENENRAYFTDTVMSWATRMENSINSQLVIEPRRYFAKYDFNMLLRGDSTARSTLYTALTNAASITPDEIREMEDMNPLPNGKGEEAVRPLNMTQGGPGGTNQNNGGAAGDERKEKKPAEDTQSADSSNNAQATAVIAMDIWRDLFMDAARRVTAAEKRGLEACPKKVNDPQDWIASFYNTHNSYAIRTFSTLEAAYQRAVGVKTNFTDSLATFYKGDASLIIANVTDGATKFVLDVSEEERAKNIVNWLLGDGHAE